jgi:hypothetical protein
MGMWPRFLSAAWIIVMMFVGVSHAQLTEGDKKQFLALLETFEVTKIRTQLDRFPELVSARGWKGFTPLQITIGAAIMNSKEEKEVIRLLIGKKADITARNDYGDTALHMVVHASHAELLLLAGAELEAKGEDGKTPLHVAANEREREDVVSFLLAKGANVCARDKFGVTAKHALFQRYKTIAASRVVAMTNCPP